VIAYLGGSWAQLVAICFFKKKYNKIGRSRQTQCFVISNQVWCHTCGHVMTSIRDGFSSILSACKSVFPSAQVWAKLSVEQHTWLVGITLSLAVCHSLYRLVPVLMEFMFSCEYFALVQTFLVLRESVTMFGSRFFDLLM